MSPLKTKRERDTREGSQAPHFYSAQKVLSARRVIENGRVLAGFGRRRFVVIDDSDDGSFDCSDLGRRDTG